MSVLIDSPTGKSSAPNDRRAPSLAAAKLKFTFGLRGVLAPQV